MSNIHQLQIPVVMVITDDNYYPLPVAIPEHFDTTLLVESMAQLEAMMQEVA